MSIEDAMRNLTTSGTVEAKCDECGRTKTVEPDASYECDRQDCDGRVKSPLRKKGLI
jgi:hypothetical protein